MSSKDSLRKSIGMALKALRGESLAAQSHLASEQLIRLEQYRNSTKIAFYMSMDTAELQTGEMICQAFRDGKRVFLPNITALEPGDRKYFPSQKRHLRMLEVNSYTEVLQLRPRGKYKLKEPTRGFDCLSDRSGLDLIVVPGLGFTRACGRLGHGGAFYDSYFKEHQALAGNMPILIGVGLREQLVSPSSLLPLEAHDKPLDVVIIADSVYTRPDRAASDVSA